MAAKNVEEYIAGLGDWQSEVVSALRALIREAAPDAKESIKWAQPVYEKNGPFCHIKSFKNTVNLGFWRGASMDDPHDLLQGEGEKMAYVKITGKNDIKPEPIKELVRTAVRLNEELGDPTKVAKK